jgi:hypothetical protein
LKKLNDAEINACRFLSQFGDKGFCPEFERGGPDVRAVQKVLDSLVRKGRASRFDDGDAGPVWKLTAEGRVDAAQ